MATLFASLPPGELQPGRVVRTERGACVVRTASAEVGATARVPATVGDWVGVVEPDPGSWIVEAVLPRHSALTRQDPGNANLEQELAANIDLVLIVASVDRLSPSRLERELLVGWESGAVPAIILTKSDLAPDAHELAAELTERLGGVEVLITSSLERVGIEAIAALLRPNRSAVLLGPSGAGKSTLANALLGEDILDTGAVRVADSRGRHTTTSRQLVPVPGGGVLIDSPGLRSLAIWSGSEGLSATFADIEGLAEGCRFRDCSHDAEPGCQVRAALAQGQLGADRLASYRKLRAEIAFAERAHDPRLQREARQKWKAIGKANRQLPKKR